ncbi:MULTISPECIES: NAD-dependent epimerase [unclassified Arenibacter]|uniref:NAD-dependent epimerase n=1 Tax=unclassified Arenibacter TaxID=2615047 RepID=UPI000E3494D9|nr:MULTISPECIES: NAD-dependent epimerase [unclassified Arenibacter]MCM4164790.1 NAD-dependent epimerase [Arenibacter sp. A80]RFT55885.1 NAD-dependent epimerase [Arenibacter sp. P308M17]
MKILVTGSAGFIGFHVTRTLLGKGHQVVGIDNINQYYDIGLKFARLQELGITKDKASHLDLGCTGELYGDQFRFIRLDITDRENLSKIFEIEKFDKVCHLAAQAGVRYSIENPEVYIDSNVVGYANILECCRHHSVQHFIYASSSSVYGLNKKIPFHEDDRVDRPISLYAATKKSNELMAHTYSHLYKIPTTGLRFFTVYGPWGRPDMALFLFTEAILKGKPINVFNKGEMERDFTHINDITMGITSVIEKILPEPTDPEELYKIYNIGNNKSVKLLDFIMEIEKNLGKSATKVMLPIQPGDVQKTWANIDRLVQDYNYKPSTSIGDGVKSFTDWYCEYYGIG